MRSGRRIGSQGRAPGSCTAGSIQRLTIVSFDHAPRRSGMPSFSRRDSGTVFSIHELLPRLPGRGFFAHPLSRSGQLGTDESAHSPGRKSKSDQEQHEPPRPPPKRRNLGSLAYPRTFTSGVVRGRQFPFTPSIAAPLSAVDPGFEPFDCCHHFIEGRNVAEDHAAHCFVVLCKGVSHCTLRHEGVAPFFCKIETIVRASKK